ncbi:glycosyltransferase [Clostridium chromiireducens]|uniref:Glycosyltransferase n=1 Tax=Clostridium chromiireducens TaxID=225345 RepID=A0A964RIQ7_9CLOT|nr:glycosyltransferase [Clostridium chromiireducens]MVX62343.1 glycosyltransferase [Clostridium chromiireducens]
MNITKQQLEETLSKINELIESSLADKACLEYVEFIKNIENEENNTDQIIKAEIYASFAYFLFNVSEYEESIKMFIKAQNYGYSKSEIKNVIWQAFIEPNINEFEGIYRKNIELLLANGYILKALDFHELSFWLIPTLTENEYYIYDKDEELIKEKISLINKLDIYSSEISLDEFADFLIVEDWNYNSIQTYVKSITRNKKKSYVVMKDYMKFLSLFQGMLINLETISDTLIFDGFDSMKEYFKGCSVYLPRNIIHLTNESELAQKTIDEIHNYRITKEGRKGDNILLSICIPSYNRGNRAYDNVIHTLQCYYDEEIEVVLSNNGSDNETKEYYDNINKINDSRLNYFAFKEDQGGTLNFCKVCEIAQGKFVLLLSDEDLVNLNVLNNIMHMLNQGKEYLSILRTTGDVQQYTPSLKLAKAGSDALFTYMLTSNYMSGIIFNNEFLKKYNGIEYIKQHLDNVACSYYPHMFWELLLCQYGNVQGSNMVFINEGKPEEFEEVKKKVEVDNKYNISEYVPRYATIEIRLEQHKGFFHIFKDLEICQNNFSVFRAMYIKLVSKTMYLVNLSIDVFYRNTDMNLFEIIESAYEFCIKYLDEMYDDIQKENLKKYFKRNLKKYYSEDMEKIKCCYEHYKNKI